MIRHIVLWKLAADGPEEKAAAVSAIAGVLEPLAHLDGIRSLSVRSNAADIEGNWDAVLVGDYDSREALDAYITHPEHLAAVLVVKQHTSARAAVDYEL